jgi:UDP-N-acetylglucosamine--N-acetylmuramyl-(pentapeptide) pyrophosphoryl-undecaprenol N-acetylglucosamine transferase
VLAGGGTGGHVLPLLTLADRLRADDPAIRIVVLGTADGLESRLVPERGYDLELIPRTPLPRRINRDAAAWPRGLATAVRQAGRVIAGADVLVGFGGYVSAPAYLAARRRRVPIVVHEANARPGFANQLGARLTRFVGVASEGTPLRHARHVGMPVRPAIAGLDRAALRGTARARLGLPATGPVLLVTGGSLGAQRLNDAFGAAAGAIAAAGAAVLHLTGVGKHVELADRPTGAPPYERREFLDEMELAFAAADLVGCRAGAMTVAELTAVGLPAVYVPLPIGNGEQRLNARPVVAAGGGLLVEDAALTPEWIRATVVPLLSDAARLSAMSAAAARCGIRDGAARLADLVYEAAGRPGPPAAGPQTDTEGAPS